MQKFLVIHPNGATQTLADPTKEDFQKILGKELDYIFPEGHAPIAFLVSWDALGQDRNDFASTVVDADVYGSAILVSMTSGEEGEDLSPWTDSKRDLAVMEMVAAVAREMNG